MPRAFQWEQSPTTHHHVAAPTLAEILKHAIVSPCIFVKEVMLTRAP